MILVLIATALSASALPPLKHDDSYARARTTLLKQGWRPVRTKRRVEGGLAKEFGNAKGMVRAGFVEVYDCAGSGPSFCKFIWKRGNQCIHVVTVGESQFGPPNMDSVRRGSCSGN